jgi:16S rRNA (cytosine1402-N4)-methyltransferase
MEAERGNDGSRRNDQFSDGEERLTDAQDPPQSGHVPVLLHEVIAGLDLGAGATAIDGTLGGGGHTSALLEATAPDGRVLGLDADPYAIERVSQRLAPALESGRLIVVQSNFSGLKEAAQTYGFVDVDAIVLDLGVSSFQLDSAGRGFSFQHDGPLDMRMDPTQAISAATIVNEWSEKELADTLYYLGEERKSRRIARQIVANRPIESTAALADVVQSALGGRRGRRIHPATRTFQALRIAVNQELDVLEAVLPQCLWLLKPGGRMAIIAFHSLEDRIVKRWMQHEAADFVRNPAHPMGGEAKQPTIRTITRRPIMPADAEVANNPRSRSARLRIAEKLPA